MKLIVETIIVAELSWKEEMCAFGYRRDVWSEPLQRTSYARCSNHLCRSLDYLFTILSDPDFISFFCIDQVLNDR